MERYESRIKILKDGIDTQEDNIQDLKEKILGAAFIIAEKEEEINKLKKARTRLPERHGLDWDGIEKDSLTEGVMKFLKSRSKRHKRTPVSIACKISDLGILRSISNDMFLEDE